LARVVVGRRGARDPAVRPASTRPGVTEVEPPDCPKPSIGIALHSGGAFPSVGQVGRDIVNALRDAYRVEHIHIGPRDTPATVDERAGQVVAASDVLLGFGGALLPLLRARQQGNSTAPCIIFVLGTLPRGARELRPLLPYIRGEDVFVVNCTADHALLKRFLPDAAVELLPLAVNRSVYFPGSREERAEARAALGVAPESQLLLYAGRITAEKNLHTTLRVFAALLPYMSDPYLLLAGPFQDMPFRELGVEPVQYARALARAAKTLGIPDERVCYLGVLSPDDLRAAYCAADVMVNLTLHHDENFGLAQVEAMACGIPVVATAWGGLKDTVRDGLTGHTVGTVVTPVGVKVDWWEAANAIYGLFVSGHPRRLEGHETVLEEYSLTNHDARLRALVDRVRGTSRSAREPVRPSAFARDFWNECSVDHAPHMTYRFHERSFGLYRDLIASYAGSTAAQLPEHVPFAATHLMSLATPIRMVGERDVDIIDPLFPARVHIPDGISGTVTRLIRVLERHPVITIQQLCQACEATQAALPGALQWMLETGILLRAPSAPHTRHLLAPERVPAHLARPLFHFTVLDDAETDFLIVRRSTPPPE
jgi:glycosyltransferase involved in cell wall biosynthesis